MGNPYARAKATKDEVGQRGKDAEKEVQKVLDKMNVRHTTFAYIRLPDARAAMGRIKKQLGDFVCCSDSQTIALEVKSVNHAYRLPKANLDQLPLLKKFYLAGAECFVLVHFKTTDKWRVVPAYLFESDVTSWDFREFSWSKEHDTAQDALDFTNCFPSVK